MAKRSKSRSKKVSKRKSKCSSHGKRSTCRPKKNCSWVKKTKNSKGNTIKAHCKTVSKKSSNKTKTKTSTCRKIKKRNRCRSSKKCNWVKGHLGRNGTRISPFCKNNPAKGSRRKRREQQNDDIVDLDDDDSSSSSDSDSDDEDGIVTPQIPMNSLQQGRVSAPGNQMSSASLPTPPLMSNLSSMPGSAQSLQRQQMNQGNALGVPQNVNQNGNAFAQYLLLKSLMNRN